ncbi:hypothetical protein B0H11DRAFT_588622 [Mycena galericulata]|nr:hypothetical protein B0H11DRAFT_588622 [Mycena galericulata]
MFFSGFLFLLPKCFSSLSGEIPNWFPYVEKLEWPVFFLYPSILASLLSLHPWHGITPARPPLGPAKRDGLETVPNPKTWILGCVTRTQTGTCSAFAACVVMRVSLHQENRIRLAVWRRCGGV